MGSRVEFGLGVGAAMVSAGRVPEEAEAVSLVSAARNGDRGAFGRLYERYGRMVHGILLARVPLAEVDDLVQDVFVQAMRQVHTLRDAACFGGWLATVTRNRANDYHRRSVELVELTEDSPSEARERRGSSAPGDDGAAILAAVRELPEAYRETLILRSLMPISRLGPRISSWVWTRHGILMPLRNSLHGVTSDRASKFMKGSYALYSF